MRPAGEQPRHLGWRFEVSLGVRVQEKAGFRNRCLFADAGHHVLKRPLLRRVIVDVVGRQDRAAVGPRHPVEPLDPGDVATAVEI